MPLDITIVPLLNNCIRPFQISLLHKKSIIRFDRTPASNRQTGHSITSLAQCRAGKTINKLTYSGTRAIGFCKLCGLLRSTVRRAPKYQVVA